jgi:two-component sensor histidine kinase
MNELVSNAYKYAFNEMDTDNRIKISFSKNEVNQTYELIVSDNGKGLPENFDAEEQGGLGLVIVQSLVEQLDGKISYTRNNGTSVEIVFPV